MAFKEIKCEDPATMRTMASTTRGGYSESENENLDSGFCMWQSYAGAE